MTDINEWFDEGFIKKHKVSDDWGVKLIIEMFRQKMTLRDLNRDQIAFCAEHIRTFDSATGGTIFAIVRGDLTCKDA